MWLILMVVSCGSCRFRQGDMASDKETWHQTRRQGIRQGDKALDKETRHKNVLMRGDFPWLIILYI